MWKVFLQVIHHLLAGTRCLLMGNQLLIIGNNYQNTELRGVHCLSCNDCTVTSMLGCVHCAVLYVATIVYVSHNTDNCDCVKSVV